MILCAGNYLLFTWGHKVRRRDLCRAQLVEDVATERQRFVTGLTENESIKSEGDFVNMMVT